MFANFSLPLEPLPMNKTRTKSIAFRVSSSEWHRLQVRIKNSGLNSQQFLIRAALEQPIVNKEAFQELLIELRHQGVNLNQIARACNSGRQQDAAEAAVAACKTLERFWQRIQLFLELEWQGIDLARLSEACGTTDSLSIKKELDAVCQYLKL
jgi:uncharacterized membrane protein YgaE (UPF0421/DUF939 family)